MADNTTTKEKKRHTLPDELERFEKLMDKITTKDENPYIEGKHYVNRFDMDNGKDGVAFKLALKWLQEHEYIAIDEEAGPMNGRYYIPANKEPDYDRFIMSCKLVESFGKSWSDKMENYQKKQGAFNHGKMSVMPFISYGMNKLKTPFINFIKNNPAFALSNEVYKTVFDAAIDIGKKSADGVKYASGIYIKLDEAIRPQKVWGLVAPEESDKLLATSRMAAISTVVLGMDIRMAIQNKIELFQRKVNPEKEHNFALKMIMRLGDKIQENIDRYLTKRQGIDIGNDVQANISRLNIHDSEVDAEGNLIKRDRIDIGIDCAEQLARLQSVRGGKTDIFVQNTGVRSNPDSAADNVFCLFKENRKAMLAALALGLSTNSVYKNTDLEFVTPDRESVKEFLTKVESEQYDLSDRQAMRYRDLIYAKTKKPQEGFPPFNADIKEFKKSLSVENVLEAIVMDKHIELTNEVNLARKMLGQGTLQESANYWHNREVDAYNEDPEAYMKTHDTLPLAAVPFVEIKQLLLMTPDEFEKMQQFHDVVVDYGDGYFEKFTKDEKPVIFENVAGRNKVEYASTLTDLSLNDLNLHHDFSSQTELFKTLAQIHLLQLTKNGSDIAEMSTDKKFIKNLGQISAGISALGGMIEKRDKDTFAVSIKDIAGSVEITTDQIIKGSYSDSLESLSRKAVHNFVNDTIYNIGVSIEEANEMIDFINNEDIDSKLDDRARDYFKALNCFQSTCQLLEKKSNYIVKNAFTDLSKVSDILRRVSEMREKLPLLQNEFEKGYFRKQVDKVLEERETELNTLCKSGELGTPEEFFGDPEDAYDEEECY